MTPVVLFPAALGALAALAIPLAIHLARRAEVRPVDFAALRWLAARPRPRTRLRFDEVLLLAVRLVLLALIALWLARPAVDGATDHTPWLAVVPGATATATLGGHRVWLARGFPPLDTPPPRAAVPVFSLLRQLDAELGPGVALTVVVPDDLGGLDAERPRLSRPVAWRVVAGATPHPMRPPRMPPSLVVRYAADRASALRYLRAAAIAWQPPGHAPVIDAAPATQPLPTGTAPLVWLVPGPVPATVAARVRRGATVVLDARAGPVAATDDVVWVSAAGAPLVTAGRLGSGRVLRLTRALDPGAMPELLDPDFPDRLAALLTPPPAPDRAAARDVAPATGGAAFAPPARDLRPWLAIVIAVVFLVERLLATRRRGA